MSEKLSRWRFLDVWYQVLVLYVNLAQGLCYSSLSTASVEVQVLFIL
jgi:hypothetical protein